MFLIISAAFFILFYNVLRDFKQAILLMFVASLPFAKGLTFEWIIIPRALVPQFALYDVGYYLILSPAYIFLITALYTGVRTWRHWKLRTIDIFVIGSFVLFVLCSLPALASTRFLTIVTLSIIQLALMGVVYLLPAITGLTKVAMKNIQYILAAFTIFETVWVIMQYISRGPLGRYLEATLALNLYGATSNENTNLLRLSGTFFESSILGTFMLMHIYYFLEILLRRSFTKKIERNIYVTSIVAAFVSIILTASRGIYVLFIIAGIIFLFVHRNKIFGIIYNKKLIKYVILVFICSTLPFLSYLISRLQTITTIFAPGGSGDFRITLIQYAIRLAEVNLFGVGLNIAPYIFAVGFPGERVFDPAQPHSIFFQILAEMGVPGLIAFLLFLWAVYRKYIISPISQAAPFFMASVIFLFAAQFYPIFISQPEILSFFFLHVGFMSWAFQEQHHGS